MKVKLLITCLFIAFSTISFSQKMRGLDKSPMDMAYYPDDFSHDRKFAPEKVGNEAFVRVVYSRPFKNDRKLFGDKIPFGKVWRVGANEATEIKFYKNVVINGQKIKAGTYSLFVIPTAEEWTFILNTDLDVWGAYSHNPAKDILKVTVKTSKTESTIENLSIQFSKSSEKSTTMKVAWDDTMADLEINY
ncbi:MAG: DUF2911 domain-containing protein [Bacteroidota bacterium]